MLTGGGYPSTERRLTRTRRDEIFARDGFKCLLCGAPADQIDHIRGHTDDPSNLRAVCRKCNIGAAFENSRTVTEDSDPELYAFIDGLFKELATRIASPVPLKVCDDEREWNSFQKQLMPQRHQRFKDMEAEREDDFEDVDGYLWHAMQKDD
ncbi:MAG TPA: hypothetical protein VGG22_15140 [Candidatus Baltobacteraceae bacterium]|jgi:hypothetical protein